MLHKLPQVGRKVTPPQPTFMTNDQKSDYLASLRQNRPARPTGSRPAPFKSRTSIDQNGPPRAESAMSLRGGASDTAHVTFEEPEHIPRSQSSFGHRHSMLSERSIPSLRSAKGRSLVQAPDDNLPLGEGGNISSTVTDEPTHKREDIAYRESGTRWLERQEAHALRQALAIMDAKDEEKRIHSAAQDEAADLVWQHQHPSEAGKEKAAGYRNPDLSKNLRSHLVRGAHERSQSDGYIALGRSDVDSKQLRNVSGGSSDSQPSDEKKEAVDDQPRTKKKRLSDAMQQLRIASGQAIARVDTSSLRNFSGGRRRMSGQRNASNKSATFPNPDDKIYEEPEEEPIGEAEVTALPEVKLHPLSTKSRNSMASGARPMPHKAESMPILSKTRPNPFDRRRKQTEQPKAAPYTSNAATPPRTLEAENVSTKNGKEIRSDDIRAATSMKRSDRSPKLPTPTAVSDRAGRPIVSFDPAWKPLAEANQESVSLPVRRRHDLWAGAVSTAEVPTINLPEERDSKLPTVSSPDDDDEDDPYDPPMGLPEPSVPGIPTFSFDGPEDHDDSNTTTAIPTIVAPVEAAPPARPLPQHTQSLPIQPNLTNTTNRLPWLHRGIPTAACASCTLPISGRIVTASDAAQQHKARFHPECFSCAHCSELLEAVAFYPEPKNKRQERLAAEQLLGANDPLRFYCHLDFHEFFSPRCRSCKTPIEGEVILAAGAEYHVGHFFCAECGDPFEQSTPFVERAGYAYCVACHRKRTSARCRGCKVLILDEGCVQALGGEWHGDCFNCDECGGGFGDDGKFFVREVEVETTAKEQRRGMETKFEQRAVCDGCEARRLKQ